MNIDTVLEELSSKLPKFSEGRIDYTDSDKAVVLTCFVEYGGKVLLLKRSDKVGTYKGLWNSVAGYIDEFVPVSEKVLMELNEELQITKDSIADMIGGETYEFYDKDINKTWIICPFLVILKKPIEIVLDWEHSDYRWVIPDKIKDFNIVPNLDKSLAFALSQKTAPAGKTS